MTKKIKDIVEENTKVKEALEESPTFQSARRDVRKAIRGLSEVYMDGEWVSNYGARSFKDIIAAENAAETSKLVRKRAAQLVEVIFDIVWDSGISNKTEAFEKLFSEFIDVTAELFITVDLENPMTENASANLSEFEEIDLSEFELPEEISTQLSEGELEVVANILNDVKEGKINAERAPLFANVTLLEAGWGNPTDNNYYPKEMLEKYSHVFNGAKMYETDHDESKRSTENWVSTSTGHINMTEDGALVHRIFIHDGDFAERMRNLKRGNLLESMECSILAGGLVEKKKFKDDEGREGRRVTSIEHVHAVDWVTRAGAKGRAMDLIETHLGGKPMSAEDKKIEEIVKKVIAETSTEIPTETTVVIREDNEGTEPVTDPQTKPEVETKVEEEGAITTGKTPEAETVLDAEEVSAVIDQTNLHELTKARLKKGKYESLTELRKEVGVAIAEVKAMTGSGAPFSIDGKAPEDLTEGDEPYVHHTEEEYQANLKEIDKAVGLNQEV